MGTVYLIVKCTRCSFRDVKSNERVICHSNLVNKMYMTPFHFTQELNTFIIILVYLFSICIIVWKNKPRNENFYSYCFKTHRFIIQSWSVTDIESQQMKKSELEYKIADSYIFDAVPPFYTFDKKQVLTAKTSMAVLSCLWGDLMSNDEYMH